MSKTQNIFITWHYTTHGIAYLKHILSEFHKKGVKASNIEWLNISQVENQTYFDTTPKGFVFDKVYYLTVEQKVIYKITDRRKYREEMPQDEMIVASGLTDVWENLLKTQNVRGDDYKPTLEGDLAFVKEYFPEKFDKFLSLLWRDIQHYEINDQIKWFKEYSNAKNIYGNQTFEAYKTKVQSLRDAKEIAKEMELFLKKIQKENPDANYFINISLGSSETQVVWHALSQAGKLPANTRFFQTYDMKNEGEDRRFKKLIINEVPINIFEKLAIKMYDKPNSTKRELADLLMQHHLKSGFSILIFGERGTGKSHLAKKYTEIVEANCASFADDTMAESDLFGHEKGAFTDAKEKKGGYFQEANGKVLFLDEIHHLSKRVQEKLMKAIQTDENNFFKIRRLGGEKDEKIKCTLIFATNRSVEELRETYLHEDFFDRIAQNCIHIPSLRETPEDREKDWEMIWEQMKFGKKENVPKEEKLLNWLKGLDLFGNFRDLQKIALYYYNFTNFEPKLKALLGFKTPFEYAKSEFEKLQSKPQASENSYFDKEKSIGEMEKHFKKDLAEWAISTLGSAEKAAKHFQEKGDKTTKETLYRWKNGNK